MATATWMKVVKTTAIDVPDLGEQIKTAREQFQSRTGDSLAAIAARAEMTTSNWYRIEKEEAKSLPVATLRQIEEGLDVDLGVEL